MIQTHTTFTVPHKNSEAFPLRFTHGIREIKSSKWKLIFPLTYLLILGMLWKKIYELCNQPSNPLYILLETVQSLLPFLFVIFSVIGVAQILVELAKPCEAQKREHELWRIGLKNSAGETPLLLSVKKKKRYCIYVFADCGVSLNEWINNKGRIASICNLHIDKISQGQYPNYIVLYTTSGKYNLPSFIKWDNKYLSDSGSVFVLGKGLFDDVYMDISNDQCQVLICGVSGSGKSNLLKLLLYQGILKRHDVIIADFKGGIDYGKKWRESCRFVRNIEELQEVVAYMYKELGDRQLLFEKADCKDLDSYNAKTGANLPRILFGADEFSEALTKSHYMSKEQKNVIDTISEQLATIGRQGRALGLHLILSIHRPDSTLVDGQMKSAMVYRICGKADSILSKIVLDIVTSETATFERGRFMDSDGKTFQAYYFDEDMWE